MIMILTHNCIYIFLTLVVVAMEVEDEETAVETTMVEGTTMVVGIITVAGKCRCSEM